MLQWNDGTSWDHRAYWGANSLGYGADGTPGRYYMGALPPGGQWVQLKVPASVVNLEGSTISGMAFTLYGGQATWSIAGRLSSSTNTAATVSLNSTNALLSRLSGNPAIITFKRVGNTQATLLVNYSVGGSAVSGQDFQLSPVNSGGASLSIPAGSGSADLTIVPLSSTNFVRGLTIHVAVAPDTSYALGSPSMLDITLGGNIVPASLRLSTNGAILTWASNSNKQYHVAYKNNLDDPAWIPIGQVTATDSTSSWTDSNPTGQRFYLVAQVD